MNTCCNGFVHKEGKLKTNFITNDSSSKVKPTQVSIT